MKVTLYCLAAYLSKVDASRLQEWRKQEAEERKRKKKAGKERVKDKGGINMVIMVYFLTSDITFELTFVGSSRSKKAKLKI